MTIAGTGIPGYNGDGILATSAQLHSPYGIAIDVNDEIYFSDRLNNRIRKILSNGKIVTIAGTGVTRFSGDNDLATKATLNGPKGIYLNTTSRELYIADSENHRVRKIAANGIISTIAGTGIPNFSGDGGLATGARLSFPSSVYSNSKGELFISDTSNLRIRKVATNGAITTIAGNGNTQYNGENIFSIAAALNFPTSVMVSSLTNEIYISEPQNSRVRKIATNGKITTITGTNTVGFSGDGGLATAAMTNYPTHVFESANGLYISDQKNNRIRLIHNGIINTIVGTGSSTFCKEGQLASNSPLGSPNGVFVDSKGEVYVAESDSSRIRKILTDGTIITIAGTGESKFSGDGFSALNATFTLPISVKIDSAGQIYIADFCRIRKITNGIITTIAGIETCGYNSLNDLATKSLLNYTSDIAISSTGEVFIADTRNSKVRKILPNGMLIVWADSSQGISSPHNLFIDETDDSLYISDATHIFKMSTKNNTFIERIVGNGTAGDSGENGPALNASINNPHGLLVSNGTLFFADTNNHKIRMVSNGTMFTIAGTGIAGFNDGVLAQKSSLNGPTGIALKPTGELVISDTSNNVIRILTVCVNCSNIESTTSNNNFTNSTSINSTTIDNTTLNSNTTQKNITTESWKCFEISSTDLGVCSGHGKCYQFNNCTCETNWTGLNCSISTNSTLVNYTTIVNSTIETNSSLVNSTINSTNIETNSTTIDNTTQYSNSTASDLIGLKCFEISSLDSGVCSGHGSCISNNTCQCNQNSIDGFWSGLNCSYCLSPYSGVKCNEKNEKSSLDIKNDNNYYAFLALLSIPILVIIILSILITICVLRFRRRKESQKPSEKITEMSECNVY